MRKWVNWAARTLATALLLSFLSIWTTGYIVNSYMETLLQQLGLPLQTQPFALSGVWGKLWGAAPAPQVTDEASGSRSHTDTAVSSSPAAPSRDETPASSSPSWPSQGEASASPSPSIPDNAAAGSESSSAGGAPSLDGENASAAEGSPNPAMPADPSAVPAMGSSAGFLDMTEEQRQTLKNLMAKLNGEQLQKLSGYLEGGLTEEELKEASDLIKPSLTDDEYKELLEILAPSAASSPSPAQIPPDPLTGREP